jgi:sec-independent protein translocase protein TatA
MGLENPLHILILLVVLLLVFGAKRLPEMGRGLGDGMRGFKESLSGESKSANEPTAAPLTAQAAPLPEAPAAPVSPATDSDTDRKLTSAA